MAITINGAAVSPPADPRVSLLDLLREYLGMPGTKKGCNQGACGACTVLVDGERIVSCLALAVSQLNRAFTPGKVILAGAFPALAGTVSARIGAGPAAITPASAGGL